jgi:hypothetical protein
MVPMPTSLLAMNTPMTEVKSSGAEPPAAMKVAPATSGLIPSCKKIEKGGNYRHVSPARGPDTNRLSYEN